jgi:predicted permease
MSALVDDLQYAVRMFERRPGFTAVFLLVLMLGVGANTAVFTVIDSVLLRPLSYPDPGRLLVLGEIPRGYPEAPGTRLTDVHYSEFCRRQTTFEHIATFDADGVDLAGSSEPVHTPAASVTAEFFETLGVEPVLGKTFLAKNVANGVLISDLLWRDQFSGDLNIAGRKVTVEGVERSIIGVLPPGFSYPDGAQLWLPLEIQYDKRVRYLRPVIGRLKRDATREKASAELRTVVGNDGVARIQPLKEAMVAEARWPLLILAGAVALVLLIGCANLANLSLIRAENRKQEIAVRAALGAPPRRIVRELLTESVLLSVAGGVAGFLFALWAIPILLSLAPEHELPRLTEIRIDWWVVAFTFAISVATGVAFGFAPAAHAVRQPLRDTLSKSAVTLSRARGLHGALVVVELALALMLLTGAGLMIKSLIRLRSLDLGFQPQNVTEMRVAVPQSVYATAASIRAFQSNLLGKIAAIPGVTAGGCVDIAPLGEFTLRGPVLPSGTVRPPADYEVEKITVSPGYFRAMGIPVLRGREFAAGDNATGVPVALVSESVARELWPRQDAIGKSVTIADEPGPRDRLTVVGVVKDIRQEASTMRRRRAVYQSYIQAAPSRFLTEVTFAVRAATDPEQLLPAMRQALHEVDPTRPAISITTMDEFMDERIATPRFETRLLGAFSVMAILLSCVGIYGVMAYSVEARTREIGIRMALGATTGVVLLHVFGRTLVLTALGVALGLAGALATTRVLTSLLFEVRATDAPTFTTVAALVALVAILAGLIPALEATRVDPASVLRYD